MEASYSAYNYLTSVARMDSILDAADASFEEVDEIPSRDQLTFTNGFYVYCTALFVDIRGSSTLSAHHRRPKLAKLYRAYVSEAVAVMKGHAKVIEISIKGDAVFGVYKTPTKPDVDGVFEQAGKLASMIDILNCKLTEHDIVNIKVGIGMDYGRALMIKAGYSGSGINDVVWMGDVVNKASNLAGYGNRTFGDSRLMISNVVYDNLNDNLKALLAKNLSRDCYHGDVVNRDMDAWRKEHC